ncbi:MAG: cyclopropane-fatty-acyl-phospholipid synthase family protein [Vicinamibacterales bacterium]|nr:cyclopropane-fatty-acyl-phospholipid synthase family protein [Vicinamibacterales bacterium]
MMTSHEHAATRTAGSTNGRAGQGHSPGWVDRLVAPMARRRLMDALAGWQAGRVTVHLPDGTEIVAGRADAEPHATLWIERDAFFRKFALGGDLGAGESYMDGDWRTDDLARFVELVLRNQSHLPLASPLSRLANLSNDLLHRLRRNTRDGSRRNIHAHYDLSNALFETFLDPSMAYSSAVYTGEADTLEDAQAAKFAAWAGRLALGPTDHVLEIGSGWGGFAMHAARTYGCRVTGITVSAEQLALSRDRVRAAGLEHLVDLRLCDYRDVTGQFSRVISIEMIEAVGREYWPAFFRKIDEVLAPGGRVGLQAITMVDHRFDDYAKHCDWIQKYIFPGGLLPSLREISTVMTRHTRLGVIGLEDRPLDYARTLRDWRGRFLERLDEVRALGFDDRFVRMWEYYLATCEAAFRTRDLGLLHLTLARAGDDLR